MSLDLFSFSFYNTCVIKVFFITALVHTIMTPDTGWLQWTQSYATKEACHEVIWKDFDKIHEAIKNNMGMKLIGIMELRCMTYDEALKLNSELGH
jgi:hypothetical protein